MHWYPEYYSNKFNMSIAVHASDFDGDADVLSASLRDKIAWFENLGGGTFSAQRVITTDTNGAKAVYAADLDGDGDPDVLSALWDDDRIAWYENLSDHGDDHGDTPAEATLVTTLPAFLHGTLESGGDRDVFRVMIGRGTLRISSNGPTDTFGTLFNRDPTLLTENDDGGAGTNFAISGEFAAGANYMEVRGFFNTTTGPYTLSIESVSR